MNNRKATKRALLTSVMALVMCVVMLVGTTFAWFTDTARANVNKIQAGKLDVALEMEDSTSTTGWTNAEGKTLEFKKAAGATSGEKVLWEPGATYQLPTLTIKNNGNLALKYKINVSGAKDADSDPNLDSLKLLDVLEWTYEVNGVAYTLDSEKHLTAKGTANDSDTLVIKATMDKNANNDYQGMAIDGIAITVVATQDTVEYDSTRNDYDANATYPMVVSQSTLNSTLTLAALKDANGNIAPVEVTLGNVTAENIAYSENNSGYTGKGVMLGSTNLNKYNATPAAEGEYKFTFKDGAINGTVAGYESIDGATTNSVFMLVPGNSDVVFENMIFNGVVSFDIQMYTSPWSYLNSITFKNCIFNGIIIGSCPANKATFDGCVFNNYTNTTYKNNSNPIWWRAATGYWGAGADESVHSLQEFTFINNEVTSTRPVKIERIGWNCEAKITFMNNKFDISKQAGDTETKNMAINIGQRDSTSKFTLIDEGNTITANTASLYTAALGSGSNQYVAVSGNKVLDGNGNNKTITVMVWKTTTGETFEMKTID